MKYVSIDLETTGIDETKHQILEIGAIIEDTENKLDFEDCPKINIILKTNHIAGDPYALDMNKGLIEKIKHFNLCKDNVEVSKLELKYKSKYLDEFEAIDLLVDFIEKEIGSEFPITVAGKNVSGFDLKFLKLMPGFRERIKVNPQVIDPGNYCVAPSDKKMPSSRECLERAGINKKDVEHIAINDAWDMIRILRAKAKGFLYK